MANLTLAIDDALLARVRSRAVQQGKSVNALVREYLEAFAGDSNDAGARVVALARTLSASSGRRGRNWTRDALHER